MPDREEIIKALDKLSDDELHDVIHKLGEDPRVKRRKGFRGWWYRYAGTVAFLSIVLGGAAGFFVIDNTIDQIQVERQARADSVTGIIDLLCTTNNDQDLLLGELVKVSLQGPRPPELTPRQERFLAIFQGALEQLENPENCDSLIERFIEGKPIPPPAPGDDDTH